MDAEIYSGQGMETLGAQRRENREKRRKKIETWDSSHGSTFVSVRSISKKRFWGIASAPLQILNAILH
jgi:hypothetical protein